MYTGVLKLCDTLVQFMPAFFISAILKTVSTKDPILGVPLGTPLRSVLLALGLLLVLMLKTIFESHYLYGIGSIGGGMRRAVSLALYDKLLRLKTCNSDTVTVSTIVNALNCTVVQHVKSI
jgi:hypothetical protein